MPARLPVRSLSASSLAAWERCRAQWKANRIDNVWEPQSLTMAAGSAYGNTLAAFFAAQIDGQPISATDADDRVLAELDAELEKTQVADEEDPGAVREQIREPVREYLTEVAPGLRPIAVERRVEVRFEGAEWSFVGYPDLECEDDLVVDFKLKTAGKGHVKQDAPRKDVQPRAYLFCRWVEGHPARFQFHSARLGGIRKGPRLAPVPSEPVEMSDRALRAFEARVARAAREIARCAESGEWEESPHGWWCNSSCPARDGCPAVHLD